MRGGKRGRGKRAIRGHGPFGKIWGIKTQCLEEDMTLQGTVRANKLFKGVSISF